VLSTDSNESKERNMFNKNKILTTPIVMFRVPILKYYKNKDKFKSALNNRKELKKLKLKDFKPIEH
jgi:hypothetical protein